MLKASIIVSLLSLFVSVLGFVTQLLLAKIFGSSIEMDAYFMAISIPMFLGGIITSAFAYTLVPHLERLKVDGVENFKKNVSGSFLVVLALSILVSILGVWSASRQIFFLGSNTNFAEEHLSTAIQISFVTWITVGLMVIVTFLTALHHIQNEFLKPAFFTIVPYLSALISAFAFVESSGLVIISIALLIGYVINAIALIITSRKILTVVGINIRHFEGMIHLLKRLPIVMLAVVSFGVFQFIDAYWGPKVGVGSLSYLGYSQRILVALGSLVIAGPSAVILPRLSKSFIEGNFKGVLIDSTRAIKLVVTFILPIALFLCILSEPIVKLMFERGSFSREDTLVLASLMPEYSIGLVAMVCVVILFRAVYACNGFRPAAIIGLLTSTIYFLTSGFLGEINGINGIAMAYTITWLIVLYVTANILWKINGYSLNVFSSYKYFLKLLGSVFVFVAIVLLANYVFDFMIFSKWQLLIVLPMIFISSFFPYFYVTVKVFNDDDINLIMLKFKSYLFFFQKT